jgi:hypothetical protein
VRQEEITVPLTATMLAAMTPSDFRARGCGQLRLAQPVSLGADAEFDVSFVRFLREALGCLLTVEWTMAALGSLELSAVCHLPPPTAGPYAERWRGEYGFGYCFYRVGPGFIHLVDVRDADDAARFLLDDPATVEAFSQLVGVVRLSELPPLAAQLADQLDQARLLLRLGDWATILPCRLRRWPMSCAAV